MATQAASRLHFQVNRGFLHLYLELGIIYDIDSKLETSVLIRYKNVNFKIAIRISSSIDSWAFALLFKNYDPDHLCHQKSNESVVDIHPLHNKDIIIMTGSITLQYYRLSMYHISQCLITWCHTQYTKFEGKTSVRLGSHKRHPYFTHTWPKGQAMGVFHELLRESRLRYIGSTMYCGCGNTSVW